MRVLLWLFFSLLLSVTHAHEVANVFTENGKMGLKDSQGNVLIPASYEKLGWTHASPVLVGQTIGYQTSEGWGLVSITNNIVTPPDFKSLDPGVGEIILAKREDQAFRFLPMGILNSSGETVIPFAYPSIREAEHGNFIVKKIVGKQDKYGVMNSKSQWIIPADYPEIRYLGADRYAGIKDGKWGLINEVGEVLSGFAFDEIAPFSQGYSKVIVRRSYGLLDVDGNLIVAPSYSSLNVVGNTVNIEEFPRWDVLTSENEKLHSVQFDSILPWEENRWKVVANQFEWLVNENFEPVTSNTFSRISRINDQLATYADGDKLGVIFQDGKPLIRAAYDSLHVDRGRIFASANSGINRGWSVFDLTGKQLTPFNYQDIKPQLSNGLIPVKRNSYWGYIDRSGKEIIACSYDYTGDVLASRMVVGFKGGEGIIDRNGSWVITPEKGKVKLMNQLYYLLTRDGVNYLKHYEKGTVYFTSNDLQAEDGFLIETREDGTFWKINLSGQIIEAHNKNDYDEIRQKSEGFIAVKIRGRFGFIDEQDRLRIAYRYQDVKDFHEGLAAFKLMGRWGFLNKQENIVIQPTYSDVTSFHNGLSIVTQNGKKGVIDAIGKIRIPIEFDDIEPLETGRYMIRQGKKFGLLDEAGRIVVNPKFDYLEDLAEGEVIVQQFGRYGVVSRRGDDLIPVTYDYLIFDPFNACYLGMKKVESTSRPIR